MNAYLPPFLPFLFLYIFGNNSLPVSVNLNPRNTSTLDFALNLPNNDTVQIGLIFRLLTYSTVNSEEKDLKSTSNTEYETTTTLNNDTTIKNDTTPTTKNKFVTVDEAIEGFRQELIKKEMEIAGIIESKDIFYRHFKLEFDDDKTITIRCTYDTNYLLRSLKISCFEYHEFETERILSNGEVEIIKQHDPDYKSNVELVDLRRMKQTYQMNISK